MKDSLIQTFLLDLKLQVLVFLLLASLMVVKILQEFVKFVVIILDHFKSFTSRDKLVLIEE